MFSDVPEAQEGENGGTASGKKKKKKKKKPAGAKSVEGQGNSLKPSKQSAFFSNFGGLFCYFRV